MVLKHLGSKSVKSSDEKFKKTRHALSLIQKLNKLKTISMTGKRVMYMLIKQKEIEFKEVLVFCLQWGKFSFRSVLKILGKFWNYENERENHCVCVYACIWEGITKSKWLRECIVYYCYCYCTVLLYFCSLCFYICFTVASKLYAK